MQLYSKEGLLFLVQIDHLNGEILGDVIESFYQAGAKNVQIVSTVTKKNRPGYMVFIDAPVQSAIEIEELIVKDCGASGWHRISSCHRHTNVSVISKEIKIRTAKGSYDFTARGKVIDDDCLNARPEYDCCSELKRLLKEKEGKYVPVKTIQGYLTEIFRRNEKELVI